jgi:SH3 domain-containing YSC84-like protein 1
MRKFIATMALVCMASWVWAASTTREEVSERLNTAGSVLTALMGAGDKGIPDQVMKGAKCIAVVPHLLKAGFVFGGQHGKGVATCRTTSGWSAPAFFTLTGGSWGAQIGGESVDLVMLFMTDQGAKHLIDSKFKIGADASAAAGPVGRQASADTTWKADTEILTYSRAKGLFAGITLNGAWVRPDEDSTTALYGRSLTQDQILLGKVPPPAGARTFLASVRGAKSQAATR